MVCPDQTVAIVTNFGTPSQVYARHRENVSRLFSRALNNCQFETLMRNIGRRLGLSWTGNAVKVDIELRGRPMWLGAIDVYRVDAQAGQHATGALQPFQDAVVKRRLGSQYSLKTCTPLP